MNSLRYFKTLPPQYYSNGKWLLNLYIIRYDATEIISDVIINGLIIKCLLELENKCISDEFTYFRVGTIFLHFGERGVDLSIWHVGKWGKTVEYFSCTWYCYGRNYLEMELLVSAEPKLSQYEVEFLVEILKKYNSIIKNNMTQKEFKEEYLRVFL